MASGFSDHLRKYLFLRAVGDGDGGEEPFDSAQGPANAVGERSRTTVRRLVCLDSGGDGGIGFFEYGLDGIRIGDLLGP